MINFFFYIAILCVGAINIIINIRNLYVYKYININIC